jgi:glycosyltransferase involved in cell wall biosynthesis
MISIVIPTVGRPSLQPLLDRLRPQVSAAPVPVELLVVRDEHRDGPAATRNRGWRAAAYDWVVFLDDDVLPAAGWLDALLADLDQPPEVGGVQGRLCVPARERPDDWAVNTARLETAVWATADMAYRRRALAAVGGFDERFPRAYREDADLAYRVRRRGWQLRQGRRTMLHPVRPESPWACLRAQRGNADDALLRRRYGPDWHEKLRAPRGRRRRHAAVAATAGLAVLTALTGRRRIAAAAGLAWLAGTAEFAAARVRRAPGSPVLGLVVTSALIPPLAVGHWLAGWYRSGRALP